MDPGDICDCDFCLLSRALGRMSAAWYSAALDSPDGYDAARLLLDLFLVTLDGPDAPPAWPVTPQDWPDLPEPSDLRVLALHAPHGPDLPGGVPVSVAA